MKKNYAYFVFIISFISFLLQNNLTKAQIDISSGLLASYTFSGNTKSSTGSAWDLTNNGATLTSDRFGNANSAYFFDGSSYMQGSFPATGYGGLTVCAWINTTYTANDLAILGYPSGVMYLNRYTPKHFMAMFDRASGNKSSAYESVATVENGWTYLVATSDGSVAKLYVNGVYQNSNSETLINDAGNGDLFVGNLYGSTNIEFVGSIDDVRFYSRPLDSAEIMTLYKLPKSGLNETPQSNINFDLFPNPVNDGKITLRSNNINGNCKLTITNMQGKILYKEGFTATGNTLDQIINVQPLKNGMYIAQVETASGIENKTFVVQ